MRSKFSLIAFLICAAGYQVSVFYFAQSLPGRIATHFGLSGQPNGWMTHGEFLRFNSFIGLALPAFILGVCYCIRFCPLSMVNVPNAAYWRMEENRPQLFAMVFEWSIWFAGVILLFLGAINYQVFEANTLSQSNLPLRQVGAMSGCFLIVMGGLTAVLIFRLRKNPAPVSRPG